jgi:hypothetical protein
VKNARKTKKISVWEQLKMNEKIKMPESASAPLLQRP